jgi:hypothetical protein
MNKLAMSTWVLGLSSMMLGALAVGCIGAPASDDEETATEAPIVRAGAPASDKETATEAPIARIGAPASDEETATEAPIAPEDRAAYAAEQMEKLKAEKEEGTVDPLGKGGPHPAVKTVLVQCDDDLNHCCFYFDDGDVLCIGD